MSGDGVTIDERAAVGACPVIHTDYRVDRPAFWHYAHLNEIREASPYYLNTSVEGFWMVTRYAEIREALQNPAVFTNDVVSPFEPHQELRLLPQLLNPPEHVKYRHILNPWFSPGSVDRIEGEARRRCRAAIDAIGDKGSCDFVAEFGIVYPTEVFLAFLGLPVTDGQQFLPWVEAIFSGFFGGDLAETAKAVDSTIAYFDDVTSDRERRPRDPATDFVTHLLQAEVDDRPLPRDEVLTICLTLMLAGLDTTRSQLGYMFHHLATHPDDRGRLIDQPELVPSAVEEFIRLYSLIITSGRFVASDVDFHGCPMKKGDVVWLGLSSANRDPRVFERPDDFVPDRSPNPHLGFAAGAHRCLGAHLARKELIIAVEEWHARIPDYRLASDRPLRERGGQLTLVSLPLAWGDQPPTTNALGV